MSTIKRLKKFFSKENVRECIKHDSPLNLLLLLEEWEKRTILGRVTVYPVMLITSWILLTIMVVMIPFVKLWDLINKKLRITAKVSTLFTRSDYERLF